MLLALLIGFVLAPSVARSEGGTTSPALAPVVEQALEVPGGTRALADAVALEPDAPRARLVLTAIRAMLGAPDLQDPDRLRVRAQARAYLETLAAYERARTALGPRPIRLALASDREARRPLQTLAAALGTELVEARRAWRLRVDDGPAAAQRRAWLDAAGAAPATLIETLNAGGAATLERHADTVPLPFPPAVWQRVLKTPEALQGSLFTSILGDRRAALLYFGGVSLDPETRAFLSAAPDVVSRLYGELPSAVFASTGRSLRIASARVVVPGGDAAVPLWEALVGAPATDPAAFTVALFTRDGGRLALFYDAVAHLSPDAQAFALGPDTVDPRHRRDRFRRLAEAAAVPLGGWDPRFRPFERVLFDVPHLLLRLRMADMGRPAGPLRAAFWDRVFTSPAIPARDDPALEGLDEGPDLDAAGLAERLAVANTALRRDRAETWLFAQRVFPAPSPEALPDALVALRGFATYRALALTLERMGIRDPGTYAVAIRVAADLSRAGGSRAWSSLAQFQGSLALVERARFARALNVEGADRLVRSLCAVPLTDDREYQGGVAAWVERDLRPAFGPVTQTPLAADPSRPVETHVLAIAAGAVTSSPYGDVARMPTVEWEGLLYRIDPATAALQRMLDVRRRQGGASLDAVLALSRATTAVASGRDRADALARLPDLTAAVAALQAMRLPPGDPEEPRMPDLDAALAALRRRLGEAGPGTADRELARATADLQRAADWHLGRVLASLAYAPHVGEADSPALLGGDPALRHDFGLSDPRADVRVRTMWSVPTEGRDERVGWKVTGALLALDVATSRFALRRVASEVMPSPPLLSDVERQALSEPVVLLSPFDQTDDDQAALVAAVRRGRARVAEASSSAERLVGLGTAAGLDEWRTEMLRWLQAHEPARVSDEWSLSEVLWVGAEAPAPNVDAWGVSGASADGNLTCAFPRRLAWTTLAGRKGSRIVAALVPDLAVGLAEALADLGLPARLTVGTLAVATRDLLDTLRTNHEDDWLTLTRQARKVLAGRIDDYIAALTIGGPLVPADTESHDGSQR